MDRNSAHAPVSRRNLLRTSAAGAVGGAALAGATVGAGALSASAAPPATPVAVAATVVRASHSATADGTIRLGVRTAIRSGRAVRDGQVLVVDGIDFFASHDEIRAAIVARVRDDVAARLIDGGEQVGPDDITVRVFGGLW